MGCRGPPIYIGRQCVPGGHSVNGRRIRAIANQKSLGGHPGRDQGRRQSILAVAAPKQFGGQSSAVRRQSANACRRRFTRSARKTSLPRSGGDCSPTNLQGWIVMPSYVCSKRQTALQPRHHERVDDESSCMRPAKLSAILRWIEELSSNFSATIFLSCWHDATRADSLGGCRSRGPFRIPRWYTITPGRGAPRSLDGLPRRIRARSLDGFARRDPSTQFSNADGPRASRHVLSCGHSWFIERGQPSALGRSTTCGGASGYG
jgi:hypothetical protein